MFVQEDFYQAEPSVVAAIMTQLSLKAGLKQWGDKAFMADHSEMKQLHLRKKFKPKHWRELTASQHQRVLESHMFLKEKRDGKVKGRTWLEETSSETTSPGRTLVCRPSPWSQSFSRES
jgi:hypothetical protein